MNVCTIFNKSLRSDASGSPTIDTTAINIIRGLIEPLTSSNSGIWYPLVIKSNNNKAKFCDPLVEVSLSSVDAFNPCNCNNNQISNLETNFYNDTKTSNLDCNYCGNYSTNWELYDYDGSSSSDVLGNAGIFNNDCCGGACDVKFKNDDFLPKVPLLNQCYLSGFYDFKHLKQFPACSNPGLGFERFITIDNFSSISSNAKFCIDWKLKETISEIPYDPSSSYHLNEYTHNKSEQKASIVSRTCGNFILTDIRQNYSGAYDIFDNVGKPKEIPSVDNFTKPYGFANQTYNNLFIGGTKLASHWKWHHTSGILGWYRHYMPSGTNVSNDRRPIPGIDLYISNGDVFFAKIEGPEPSNNDYDFQNTSESDTFIKSCPSGLKVVDKKTFKGIVPSGSDCVYISHNLYGKFYSFYEKYTELGLNHQESLQLSSIMATAPLYDGYTVDLLSADGPTLYDAFNAYKQIDKLNRDMLVTTNYGSPDGLNYIKDTDSLINTLFYKYGGYLWIPPNSSEDISFNLNTTAKSMYIDIDFDMVIDKDNLFFANSRVNVAKFCVDGLPARRNFSYNQEIRAGVATVASNLSNSYRHKTSCDNGNITNYDFALYGNVLLNGEVFKSIPAYSGAYRFLDIYPRIVDEDQLNSARYCTECGANSSFYLTTPAESMCNPPFINGVRDDSKTFCYSRLANFLNNSEGPGQPDGRRPLRSISDGTEYWSRGYPALAYNPHIDLVAFHEHGGVYFNSSVFGENQRIVFNKNIGNNTPSNVLIKFITQDVGIKIYNIYVEKLQSADNDSIYCKRFPIENENICKCYGLNLSNYGERSESCGTTVTSYSTANIYVPNLSTRNSPRLRQYGGYSVQEVKDLFDLDVETPGSVFLPDIIEKLDPENPYSCYKNATINLANYTTSNYTLMLKNFTTNHTDIYFKVSEGIDYTGQSQYAVYDEYGEEVGYNPNYNWKRFLNKVVVNNNITLYKDQKKVVYQAGSPVGNTLDIKITNPFLNALLGNTDERLLAPTGRQCAVYSQNNFIFGPRGDELSSVNIEVLQKPRKQLLNFKFHPKQSSLFSLQKGSFGPSNGLTSQIFNGPNEAILENGSINYAEELKKIQQRSEDNEFWKSSNSLIGDLTPSIKNIFNSIDQFALHKKPRLYINTNGRWYTASLHNRGGYTLNDKSFIGAPRFLEYLQSLSKSQQIACLNPAVRKKPVYLNSVPLSKITKCDIIDVYTIRIPGSYMYFRIHEKRNIFEVEEETIDSYITNPNPDISTQSLIKLKNSSGYFLYIGPTNNVLKNYIFIGEDPTILDKSSNLEIDYDNVSTGGFLYNTNADCNEAVIMYASNPETWVVPTEIERVENFIIGKKLIVRFYDNNGKLVDGDYEGQKNIRVYTELKLRNRNRYNYLALNKTTFFEFYPTPSSTDKDPLLTNKQYITKWGDVLLYDGFLLNNPNIINLRSNYLPPTIYNNIFYKQIINDNLDNFIFLNQYLVNNNVVSQVEDIIKPYFFIRQKYNLNDEQAWSQNVAQFQNYIPIMEVTFPNNNIIYSGIITSSSLFNIYTNREEQPEGYIDPNETPKFFINNLSTFETAFIPSPTSNFYSESLRIDDPLFWLSQTTKQENISLPSDQTVSSIIKPDNVNTYSNTFNFSNFEGRSINRTSPFYLQTIYADMDQPDSCGEQLSFSSFDKRATCVFRNIGTVQLKATYKSAIPTEITYDSLPDTVNAFISYEGGTYNPIGDNRYISIVRTELPPDNLIDTEITCGTTTPLPSYKKTLTSLYQDYINNNTNNNIHSANVLNMDKHANEMLFRILYGEKQPVNKQQLFIDKKPLTKNDLIGYVDPTIKAKDIYDEILYNYDKNARANISVTGSLSINGNLAIGDSIDISIGDVNINLYIYQNDNNDVMIGGDVGGNTILNKLYENKYIAKSLITQTYNFNDPVPPAPQPTSDAEAIELVATRTFTNMGTPRVNWQPPPDPPVEVFGGFLIGKAYGAVGVDWLKMVRTPNPPPPPCAQETKSWDPFTYGYCRIDDEQRDCDPCELYEGIETPFGNPNFTYEFEDCNRKFKLYGHVYRKKYGAVDSGGGDDDGDTDLPDLGDQDPSQEPDPRPPQNQGYPPPGASCPNPEVVNYGCWVEPCYSHFTLDQTPCGGCCEITTDPPTLNVTRKVYVKTTTHEADPYAPRPCPVNFITISYTTNKLTVNIPNNKAALQTVNNELKVVQTPYVQDLCVPLDFTEGCPVCVPLNLNGQCPDIRINYIPPSYTITESINSSCGNNCDNDANIEINNQNITGQTKEYTAVCIVGRLSYGNVNGGTLYPVYRGSRASDGTDDFGRSLPPCYGNGGSLYSLCDGSFPWRVCENAKVLRVGYNHDNYWEYNGAGSVTILECDPDKFSLDVHGELASRQAENWIEEKRKQYQQSFVSEYRGTYTPGDYNGINYACNLNPLINTEDIFEGIIPGTCEFHTQTFTKTVPKYRILSAGGVEGSTMTITTIVAYLTYTYKTSKTIRSALNEIFSPEDTDSIVSEPERVNAQGDVIPATVKTNNSLGNCPSKPFPDHLTPTDYRGYPISINNTYLLTTPVLSKTACNPSIVCYNNQDNKQTVCDQRDWICWSSQNPSTTSLFLSRLNRENW